MLCRRCAHFGSWVSTRSLSTLPAFLAPLNTTPATSTSAAQPFSTPFTPTPAKDPSIPTSKSSFHPAPPKSSLPAGAPLRGLGYIKGEESPTAREDHEYPDWLWGLLDESKSKKGESGENEGDAFAKSKKQRRIASKAARARMTAGLQGPELAVKVPLHEQSIDLPAGMEEREGKEALEARGELRGSMRDARRKKIREDNYLKGMR
ncbi:MAG: hypothetical protein Q9163_001439 [Psora crenata]